jgi:hypothetical protein
VGDSEQWSSIVSAADENGQNYCKALTGKTLFTALYGTCTVALHKLKAMLKASNQAAPSEAPKFSSTQKDGYKEVQRRKRHSTNESRPPRRLPPATSSPPLKTSMEMESTTTESATPEETVSGKAGRPPVNRTKFRFKLCYVGVIDRV